MAQLIQTERERGREVGKREREGQGMANEGKRRKIVKGLLQHADGFTIYLEYLGIQIRKWT